MLPATGLVVGLSASPAAAQTGITPFINCVSYDQPDQTLTVNFGYVSANSDPVIVPFGPDNFMSPNPANRGQPTDCLPGTVNDAWHTVVDLTVDPNGVTWNLLGQQAIATVSSGLCTNAPPIYDGGVSVLGSPVVGQQLVATTGAWDGDVVLPYGFQWQFQDSGGIWHNISGAMSQTFTPALAQLGTPLRVEVTADGAGGGSTTVDSAATVAVGAATSPLSVTTTSLPAGQVASAYTASLAATGGTTPYSWALSGGTTLPGGLSLDPGSGAITGTPTAAGTTSFTVVATDSTSPTHLSATAGFAITVIAMTATSLASSSNPAATGEEVTYTATVTPTPNGGSADFTDGGTTIGGCGSVPVSTTTGVAVCDPIYSTPGAHTVGTSYSGDADFARSSAPTLNEVVKPGVVRIFGPDAIGTAIAVSQAEFATPGSAGGVVLARSDFFSDALAGGPLAARVHGPLLITPGASLNSGLDPRVLTEVQRVLPFGGSVYVLGGSLALSPGIDSTLEGLGYSVVREAGADQYATAIDIAQQLGNPTTVFEVTGLSFYDSMSAGPAAVTSAGAILLTDGATQSPATSAYLAAHPGDRRYAIGGPLAAAGADPSATAIYGQDLYGTSATVATRFFPHATTFGAATSATFSDALSAGPGLGSASAPMLLVPPSGPLPTNIEDYLSTVASGLNGGTLYG
ncbi:MAG: cell wall-binding repeat-containing protein, partial [Acidimicrobiales bacterium]